jgi:hypothetical protein
MKKVPKGSNSRVPKNLINGLMVTNLKIMSMMSASSWPQKCGEPDFSTQWEDCKRDTNFAFKATARDERKFIFTLKSCFLGIKSTKT